MAKRWVELSKVTKEVDIEIDYLCDLVINGSVKTMKRNNELLVDIKSLPNASIEEETSKDSSLYNIKDELDSVKIEYTWLKSENMRNNQLIEEYQEKCTELEETQNRLKLVINNQAATIRKLKGYNGKTKNSIPDREKAGLGLSLWMLMPIIGLLITAALEITKKYHVNNFSDVIKLLAQI